MTTTTHQTTTLNIAELKARLKDRLRDAPSDNHWLLCPSCECGISATDLDAGNCTNCGVGLIFIKLTDV